MIEGTSQMCYGSTRRFQRLQIYCKASAIGATAVGCLVLYGWAFHVELFLSVLPGFVTMKANTAFGFALSGASLWLLLPSESRAWRRLLGRFLAFVVILLGGTTLAEYALGLNVGIDQLLFHEHEGAVATYSPGRMDPSSTTAFVAIGLSLMLLDSKTRRRQQAAQLLSLWATLIAMLAIVGYIYHATAFYRFFLSTQIAVHTAAILFLLGVAIFFARPNEGVAHDLTGEAPGSVVARRLLPAVFLVPIFLGWIGLQGQLVGLYGTELDLALYASASVLVLALLLWSSARQVNGEYDQRSRAEVALRELNADLENRVADRTRILEQQKAVLTEQAALLDLARDAIVVRDMQDHVLFWNHGAEVIYGWSREEALGKDTFALLKTEFFGSAEIIRTKLLQQGHWDGDAIQHKSDGTRLIVASRSVVQRDAGGAPVRILTINNDVTEAKRAESELRSLTERLSLATAVAKVGVWEWDLPSNLLTWDSTMFEIYGLSLNAAITYEQWAALVQPEDLQRAEATLRKAIEEKGQGTLEFRVVRQDGSLRNLSSVYRVVLDERANVSRIVGVNMDVTERKDAENALEKSRKDQLRFKDEFLSHVSHEIRSPLSAIMQFTTLVLDGLAGGLSERQREYEQIVLQNAQQLQSMIDDLLEVTRLENGKLSVEPESLSVSDAVTDSLNTLHGNASAAGVSLSCQLPSGLPAAYADPTRLRQILIILADNAIKFTPFGGTVKIEVRPWEQDSEFLCVEVSDTGCGISVQNLQRIFERLYQTSEDHKPNRKGLGLGLFICKELVTRQGGQIWVESQVQKGSTFSFTLPIFSLKKLMTPLLRNGKWPTESAAVVMVEISLHRAWTSKESQEKWDREVRGLLRDCMLPNLDVLLPKMTHRGEGERFFIVALADETGASVLANRIKEQFERSPGLTHSVRNFMVSFTMANPPVLQEAASQDDMVTNLVSSLEETIRSKSILAVAHHA